jgi:dethiobiotin synthetase/adenosylmethionine--8-amino-7-oxononanoate aminotransferase
VSAVHPPPQPISDPTDNFASTTKYYTEIVPDDKKGGVYDLLHHLDEAHTRRLKELGTLPQRSMDCIWWPFVQHGLVQDKQDVTVIDSAWSDFFSVYSPASVSYSQSKPLQSELSVLQSQFDGSASWWTQGLGHAHPSLTLAAARAAGRYGHVIFPQAIHLPALKLAEGLLYDGPGKGWASRAFFSDDGATGMEVALKMALRAFSVKEGLRTKKNSEFREKETLGIIGLKGSYHGDTIGAMDACEEGVFTCEWHDSKGYWFDPPTVAIQRGQTIVTLPSALVSRLGSDHIDAKSLSWVYDVPERLHTELADVYRGYILDTLRDIRKSGGPRPAALVLEPLVMGAGGMIFVDPLFQRIIIDVVRGDNQSLPSSVWSGMPVIFDEVFVGLYRIGMQSTAALLGVNPDISVHAKILTGGLVPLAVTLSTDSIFQAFMSQNKADALLHGHSYTAHPIGCEVANETLSIIKGLASGEPWKEAKRMWASSSETRDANVWSFWNPDFVRTISRISMVGEVMTLGTVLVIKFRGGQGGE